MNAPTVIPGPHHPDLFDGETPQQCSPDDLAAYRVGVAPAGHREVRVVLELAAFTAPQACRRAEAIVLGREPSGELETVSLERLERPVTADEKRAYLARHGGVA
ncbi:hypothetical protein [Halomonas saccharevitans]|uniref:Uncharacterized protein n=1 Tax=Halomonas saccharevitans TaxID=416872 RepID=A0A1I7AH96_9GAMM|nr:hypothetical protein [Halomonas saccharevitans]SFT74268.1 hypothetical protein SAMN04487956_11780 [Halomonas saccharevitans]